MTPYVILPQSLKLFFSFNSGESILLQNTNLIPAMLSQYDNFPNCAVSMAQKATEKTSYKGHGNSRAHTLCSQKVNQEAHDLQICAPVYLRQDTKIQLNTHDKWT